jgi:hypothetical protein
VKNRTINRHIPIALPPDLYSRLEQLAQANDRDPLQQARRILRMALTNPSEFDSLAAGANPSGDMLAKEVVGVAASS